MWQAWICIIAGAWGIFSAFLKDFDVAGNFFILGIVITVFSFWNTRIRWQGIINGLIGIWLIVTGFFPAWQATVNLWVSGVLVVLFASWSFCANRCKDSIPD